MECKKCGMGLEFYGLEEMKIRNMLVKYSVPFNCLQCGSLDFKYQAIRDLVFVFPLKTPDKIGSIFLSDSIKNMYEQEYGIGLSVGKGYWTKKGKFKSTFINVGDLVIYDKQIPWILRILDTYGKKCKIKYMGYQDVKALVKDY